MAAQTGVVRMRLERLADERDRTSEKLNDLLGVAEEEQRDLNDFEKEQATKYRTRITDIEDELVVLAADVERTSSAIDVSRMLRQDDDSDTPRRYATPRSDGPVVYRSYAEYARDAMITRYPTIANLAANGGDVQRLVTEAQERIQRAVQNTTVAGAPGLWPAQHMAQIMDIIDSSRPLVASGRSVPLDRGKLTYPAITQRPDVQKQSSEKTQGGSLSLTVDLETLTADTYIGGGDLSWQAINWSTPDALSLWFDLAAEAYARATEEAAADALEDTAGIGTVGTASNRLGTAGTETFAQWRSAVIAGVSAIYTATGGRARTDTLYLSAARFFQLAGIGTDQTLQVSAVGSLDIGSMTGTFSGLRVVGSYAFDQDVAIVGDSQAFLVGETPGTPVELRAVEPTIGGMEVGVIGAFAAVPFDANRFYFLSTHL